MTKTQTHSKHAFMVVLASCNNEEDPFKNGHNRSFIVSLCGLFLDAQSEVGSASD